MSTACPRCGRVAEEEFVCPDCGRSLALARLNDEDTTPVPVLADTFGFDSEDAPEGPDPRVWRLAAAVVICCLVAAGVALLLLHQHGSPRKSAALPITSSTAPGRSGSGPTAGTSRAAAAPNSHPVATPTMPVPTTSNPATRPRSSPAGESTAAPRSSSPSLAAATRSVHVARGAADSQCGPHCYRVVVTLASFPAGAHNVTCWSAHSGQFAGYTTSATTSADCTFRRPHDSVWAVVDGRYRSNTVSWPVG